jgi:peptide/nickel transport system permease protein
MQKYVARRLFLFLPSLFLAATVLFLVMRVLPGDVAIAILGGGDEGSSFRMADVEKIRETLGLNDNILIQYGRWLKQVFSGRFGESIASGDTVRSIIAKRLPATLQLSIYVLVISAFISIPLGVAAGLFHDQWPDYLIRSVTILGLSMPNFWVALLVILGLVIYFDWVPPIIYQDIWESPKEHLTLMIWPALVLSWGYSSFLIRMTRSTFLEVLREDYIRTAQSKGLSTRVILERHALRNALLPVVTLGGAYLANLLNGTVILESIFGIPGIGREIVDAVRNRDYPVAQGLGLLFIFIMLTVNLLVDLLYAWIDPRIKYS